MKTFQRILLALAAPGLVVSFASNVQAQTAVQLPTFNFFTVTTTVSVPDRGGVLMGGVNRASSGRNEFGPPFLPHNRAIGMERSATNISMTATIHDLHDMDADILARSNYVLRDPPEAAGIRQLASARGQTVSPTSIAAIQQQIELAKFAEQQDALASFEKGLKAEEGGKVASARIHYQMALKRAKGDLKTVVEERMAGLSKSQSTSSRVAQTPE